MNWKAQEDVITAEARQMGHPIGPFEIRRSEVGFGPIAKRATCWRCGSTWNISFSEQGFTVIKKVKVRCIMRRKFSRQRAA